MYRSHLVKQFFGVLILCFLIAFVLGMSWFPLTSNKVIKHDALNSHYDYKIVFFGFSACPEVCPSTLATLSKVFKSHSNISAQVIFIEILEHDASQAADIYAKSFNANFIGIAPSLNELNTLSSMFGETIKYGQGMPQHQGRLYLVQTIKGEHTLFKTYNALTFSIPNLINDIKYRA